MLSFLQTFIHQVYALLPFFSLIAVGFLLVKGFKLPTSLTTLLTKFLFNIAMPVMLFGVMSKFHSQPKMDHRLIIAYFGGSLILFVLGLIYAKYVLKLTSKEGAVYGIGGIFSNNVMIGIPIIMLFMGKSAIAVSALIISVNTMLLWSLVSFTIEWAEHGSFSAKGIFSTFKGVLKNPIILGIIIGLIVSETELPIPAVMDSGINLVSKIVSPLSLLVLGMGLARYRVKANLKVTLNLTASKLILHPLLIWIMARLLGLPEFETKAIVILGSIAMGMNVYLMALKFKVIEDVVASSILLTTMLSALTTPLIVVLI